MWEISSNLQIANFLRAVLLGGFFCLLYDLFSAARKAGANSTAAVFLQDIFYFVIIAPITFCFLLATTNGEVRAYIIFGVFLGFTQVGS